MTGRLFAVIGPSGAGKDTLLEGVCAAGGPHWARRVITRPQALGGEPYEGVTDTEFAARAARGEFALSWQAHGLSYGIPMVELAARAQGRDVVFNGSRGALDQALAVFPDLIVVQITAPPEIIAQRLQARGREGAQDIARRLARDVAPLPRSVPVIEVCNDADPETGIARLRAAFQVPDKAAR